MEGMASMVPINHVCAYLGTIDPAFDAQKTYFELEAKEREQTIQAKAKEVQMKFIERMQTSKHLQDLYTGRVYLEDPSSARTAVAEANFARLIVELSGGTVGVVPGSTKLGAFYG